MEIKNFESFDVVIIGASASGLMCAIEAGKKGKKVIVLDHANKVGKKILMSGGGRCNFTNYYVSPENYISRNKHFCKSALSRYTPYDFIRLIEKYDIPYHEKKLGQLFCDNKAKDIVNMLLDLSEKNNVIISLNTKINKIKKLSNKEQGKNRYYIESTKIEDKVESNMYLVCNSLVIATGGLSIPTMGASSFGYDIAKQFDINVWPTSAALVPFTLDSKKLDILSELSGISTDTIIYNNPNNNKYNTDNKSINKTASINFRENILFTHRGLSGPAILQISSYWKKGESIFINLIPNNNLNLILQSFVSENKNIEKTLKNALAKFLPKRLLPKLFTMEILNLNISNINNKLLEIINNKLTKWELKPNGTEGYRTAEVTLGGVDCNEISSKTMESRKHIGLYFIGEVLDVTGWLGGYNFQWAWASGWCAGQAV